VSNPCWCGADDFGPAPHAAYSICGACGSATTNELIARGAAEMRGPLAELYGESYWTEHQAAHGMPVIEERARTDLGERCSYWLGHLLRYLRTPARVLEVGCGHGGLLHLLRLCGCEVRGIEIDEDVARFGKEQFGVNVTAGFFEGPDDSLGSYDAVLMLDVLEHLVDPVDAIGRVMRHLQPDGIVVVQTPCHRPDLSADWPMYFPPEHTVLFSRDGVTSLLARHGLTNVQFEPALFDYDMFLFASREPLEPAGDREAQRRLERSPDGRIVLALLELSSSHREALSSVAALRADLAGREAEIDQLDSYARALWKSRWVQLGRRLGLTRTEPPSAT